MAQLNAALKSTIREPWQKWLNDPAADKDFEYHRGRMDVVRSEPERVIFRTAYTAYREGKVVLFQRRLGVDRMGNILYSYVARKLRPREYGVPTWYNERDKRESK